MCIRDRLDAQAFGVLHAHLHHRIGQQAALPGHIVQTGVQGIGDTGTGTEQERILLRVGIVGRTVGGQGIQSPFGMGGNALGVELQLASGGVDAPFQNSADRIGGCLLYTSRCV